MSGFKQCPGFCPRCAEHIEEYQGIAGGYEHKFGKHYTCAKCQFPGIEWHEMQFDKHTDYRGKEVGLCGST